VTRHPTVGHHGHGQMNCFDSFVQANVFTAISDGQALLVRKNGLLVFTQNVKRGSFSAIKFAAQWVKGQCSVGVVQSLATIGEQKGSGRAIGMQYGEKNLLVGFGLGLVVCCSCWWLVGCCGIGCMGCIGCCWWWWWWGG